MKYSTVLVGGLASIASAHSVARDANSVVPQLVGGRKFLSEMKARGALPEAAIPAAHTETKREAAGVVERQNADGRCGPGFGKCTTGCCSGAGWCGTTEEYCAAPDCLFQYGPDCDANKIPSGTSTASIARTKVGSVEYGGTGIYDCAVAGDIALTFDDGPYLYTSDLLDKLDAYGYKATFFITGNNLGKGAIDTTATWSNLIKRMVAGGHQVASHTWSHQNLTSLDPTTFDNQIVHNEMAIRNILGYFPTYMRPPYSECNSTCSARLANLGYHVTYFDLDTAGYLNPSAELIQNSKNIWDAAINPSNPATDSFLQIEHDIQPFSVYNLTDYILTSMKSKGYKGVTVGDCVADPQANWYRADGGTVPTGTATATTSAPTSTSTSGLAVSTDGTCGTTTTCSGSSFGNCCSQYGWCGSTTDHCSTGCQTGFGTCTGTGTTTSQKSSTSSKATSSSSKSSSTLKTSSSTKISSSSTKLTSTSKTSTSTLKVTTTAKSTSTTTKTTSKSNTSTKAPTATSTTPASSISVDGSCSSSITCVGSTFGNCCSQYGFCGSTTAYCGTGCNPLGGTCT